MSPTLKDPSFKQKGELTDDLIKEHTVPSCGIGAKDAIQKAGWDGNSASIAVGLTIGPTGECIKSARAFGVGFHDNSWTISSDKVWGGKEGYKIAINMKDMTCLSFPSNLLNTTYIDSSEVVWYAYNKEGEKTKLKVSEHAQNDIKEFCIRASIELVDARLARVCYAIVPVPLDSLKKEYLEHLDKLGFPTIHFHTKEIPLVPLAENDWELPSPVVPLFLDDRTTENQDVLPEAQEIWLKFAQFLRSSTSPNLVNNYNEWIEYLSDNPTFEAMPSSSLWPLPPSGSPSSAGEESICFAYIAQFLDEIQFENSEILSV